MKVYFAGSGISDKLMTKFKKEKLKEGEEYCFLNSYFEIKNKKPQQIESRYLSDLLKPEDFFLDSGAYSASTIGAEIDIDDYIRFIKRYNFVLYSNLDKIGDSEQSERNQKYMESKGLKPIPVFHYGSDIEILKELVKKYPYIALGGLVPLSNQRKRLKRWLSKCFYITQGKVKCHGFGVNSFEIWKQFPFYSVDATSWLAGGRFRMMIDFRNNRIITHSKLHSKNTDLGRIKVISSQHYELNCHNMEQYYKASKYVTKLWEKRGIKWD